MQIRLDKETIKNLKKIDIDTGDFLKINTNLLLKRTYEKIKEKDLNKLQIPMPFNFRIRNLIVSLRSLISCQEVATRM